MALRRIFFACLFSLGATAAHAASRPPTAEQVFHLSAARTTEGGLALDWTIAPDAHLYRDRIAAATADGRPVPVADPPGLSEDDPTFGPTEVYRGAAHATVAAKDLPPSGDIIVSYQGCSDRGLCYPPLASRVDPVTLAVEAAAPPVLADAPVSSAPVAAPGPGEAVPAPASLTPASFSGPSLSGALLPTLPTFLGLGLLLSLTPCVFPMVPILAGVLAGGGRPTASRGLLLSSCYVLASASAYALVGVAAAWSGESLQAALQRPAVLLATAALYAVLALSMFGLFELQLPTALATRLSGVSPARRGTLAGAAALGFVSALVVGPCVTPPLAAALLYVARTGDALRGASALFALGLGMGLPLVVAGTFGSKLLPRSGPWLLVVRQAFGVVFLALAVGVAGRALPDPASLALWGVLAVGTGVAVGGLDALAPSAATGLRLRKAAGLVATAYGLALLVGAAGGASDPLRPLGFLARGEAVAGAAPLAAAAIVRSPEALDASLAEAADRPVMVDFSAAWCTACRAFERDVLADPAVRARLAAGALVIRADVTASDAGARALMSRFDVVGPPTILFLSGRGGAEIPGTRLVGEPTRANFDRALDRAGLPST
ncbi:protein-disulfide reductase DsbD [Lichenibacterium dinghuense]|uniref:protein-disulfide reductase DsbD n=1 Tax=Lichenibacterium dinghuense TaxID=2895977 RepID=UPI001F01530B|nr:protein-disulfide reductase DsbD [Lichenibacterium sp. 6Y81]